MNLPRYLGDFATLTPEKPAAINGTTGEMITYRQLDERSNRLAQFLFGMGLRRGDCVAMVLENNMRCFELAWAAFRSGLLLAPVNRFLTADEAAYIVADSNAKAVVSSYAMRDLAGDLTQRMPTCSLRLMVDGAIPGWQSYEDAIASASPKALDKQWLGGTLLYSSGTTGRPKGIHRILPDALVTDSMEASRAATIFRYGFDANSIYLSTAPLYHAAPLYWATNLQFVGGTTVYMEKFDPLTALSLIERYRVSHSQWVPTMFIRLLKLTPEERNGFDLSSLRFAVHAAAPCPAEVKRKMIDWWGPIIYEYYGSSESNGATSIDSREALERPGSVGKALVGTIHVCDEEGNELPPERDGLIYFERDVLPFHYHNDPQKTKAAQHPRHPTWTAVGDIGHLDQDGYLYLTDRASFMIISGGVNVYPQAIENALALHPKVADVAIIGVPDPDLGESVKAIIEPAPGIASTAALAEEIIEYLRGKVARYMVPKSVDFIDKMPRLPTGKLYKKGLRDKYRSADQA